MSNTSLTPDRRIAWPQDCDPATSVVFAQNVIDIAASPETAWSLLVDCTAWPEWYRHCSDVSILTSGPVLAQASQFRFKTIGFYFEPVVETFQPFNTLIWTAKGPAGTRGAHAWFIEPTADGCRVITEEAQWGWLLRVIGKRTQRTLLESHEEWLRALKTLAEGN